MSTATLPDAIGAAEAEAKVHPWGRRLAADGVPLVHRSQVDPAAYNPRQIDLPAKVKLREGLREFGLAEPLIRNGRNRRLVGGHQRLRLMDEDVGHGNYLVPCVTLDLDDTREKELNVLLNNPGAQGFWDWTKLARTMASDKGFRAELAGFDPVLLKGDFRAFADTGGLDLSHVFGAEADDPAKPDADEIARMKASKAEYQAGANAAGDKDGFYLMVVFPTVTEKERFCDGVGVNPDAKVTDGRAVAVRLGIDIGWEPPADPEPDGVGHIGGEARF